MHSSIALMHSILSFM